MRAAVAVASPLCACVCCKTNIQPNVDSEQPEKKGKVKSKNIHSQKKETINSTGDSSPSEMELTDDENVLRRSCVKDKPWLDMTEEERIDYSKRGRKRRHTYRNVYASR